MVAAMTTNSISIGDGIALRCQKCGSPYLGSSGTVMIDPEDVQIELVCTLCEREFKLVVRYREGQTVLELRDSLPASLTRFVKGGER
jgi:hypothetical protein